MIKLLIADSQTLIRQSLEITLNNQDNLSVIASVSTGQEILDHIRQKIPDMILMDIRMPEIDGIQCIKIVKEQYPQIKILILTTIENDNFVFHAFKNGVNGYLLKGVSMDELVSAIDSVYNGQTVMHPVIAAIFLQLFSKMARADQSIPIHKEQVKELSNPEWKVIKQVGNGLSNKEIAQKLHFTENTVKNYLSSILSKLGLRDRTQLAIWVVQFGKMMYETDFCTE